MIPKTLVLCAAPNGVPTKGCLDFLQLMMCAGATVQLGQCATDVTLTRCLQAADAYDMLRRRDDLQYVLWVDSDMHTTLASVALMLNIVQSEQRADVDCNVSGAYRNRHRSNQLAAWAIKGEPGAQAFVHEVDETTSVELVPALTGMGCLLQTRNAFVSHCHESEHMCYPTIDTMIPVVCQSHPIHASELAQYIDVNANQDLLYWQGEDFDYCAREFDAGRPVYHCPVPWNHDCRSALVPDLETVFPGLRPPPESQ